MVKLAGFEKILKVNFCYIRIQDPEEQNIPGRFETIANVSREKFYLEN